MNRSVWSKVGVCAAVSALTTLSCGSVFAEDEPADSLSLKIAGAIKPDRFFVRGGVIYVKVKTKSGDTYDVTGPVATRDELLSVFTTPESLRAIDVTGSTRTQAQVGASLRNAIRGIPLITNQMQALGVDSLGTPEGIKGEAGKGMGTAGISLGYFFDDNQNWLAETYVLAAPLTSSVTARTGLVTREDPDTGETFTRPLLIDGRKIITTKLLPPTLMLGRYWGNKTSPFRLYTGAMATYAIFFDTKASDYLNTYQGGSKPGDTSVSIKNSFGLGPLVGFKYQINDSWHASLNVGHVKLKTTATITTRNSTFDLNTPALQDLGAISDTLYAAEFNYGPDGGAGSAADRAVIAANGGVSAMVTKAVLAARNPDVPVDQLNSTYVRKTDVSLTNTLFFLSIGRSF